MAKLSSDGKYVTVEKGDTLWDIAEEFLKDPYKYKQLAAINDISNPNLIGIGEKIYLSSTGTSTKKKNSNFVTIKQFGLQADVENTLLVTWEWTKSNTEEYKVEWAYYTKDKVWFRESEVTTKYKYSTYSIPDIATHVRVRIKPIAKNTKVVDGKKTAEWVAVWTAFKDNQFTVSKELPPTKPSTPSLEIEDYKLKMELNNVDSDTTKIKFEIVQDNKSKAFETKTVTVKTGYAVYTRTVPAGSVYKVRCKAVRGSLESDWTDYTNNVGTAPAAPAEIIKLKALSETSVSIDWTNVKNVDTYVVEYTTKKGYFDSNPSEVKSATVDGTVVGHAEITGMETGEEYFFRVKATNSEGDSAWTPIKSIKIGKKPVAPTTWSSTTTVICGEPLNLYWVHNAEDGSSQTYAELELIIGGNTQTLTIKNDRSEEDKDKTSVYTVSTSDYPEGTKIQWRVRTSGITNTYGDWSIQRTVDIYAPPTLELNIVTSDNGSIETVTAFPFYISALAGPSTQAPTGYQLSISSNEIYETVDAVGNVKMVNEGEAIFSKFYDTSDPLMVEVSADNLNLENGVSYTVHCTVSMNSGLVTEASAEISVSWAEVEYVPNAEINVDDKIFTATLRPYCEKEEISYYKVTESSGIYTKTTEELNSVWGEEVAGGFTTTNEQVYSGTTAEGEDIYYCIVETSTLVEDVLLSVYRREFDGTFTEIAKGLENTNGTYITDPHPALDYARYRIVATEKSTGAVSFYDMPSYPVGGKAAIIQWDEEWSSFDVSGGEDELEQPPWSGSMLQLLYNIDVSDKHSKEVELVRYAGRERPVDYYGTHLDTSQTWNVSVPAEDKETLYTLRRLSIWKGNVYVREPSGTGYWASIDVSYNINHKEVTIPVTINITRVEGGM